MSRIIFMSNNPQFSHFSLSGIDAPKFLTGQITCSVDKLNQHYQATAICNLKGRVHFGLWIAKVADAQFDIVLSHDYTEDFIAHIKKYGAFSKIEIGEVADIYPCIIDDETTFSKDKNFDTDEQNNQWQIASIASGNYWITAATQALFQPQELRLHQRGGVDYDKGCYLGQEVIARIYFKSAPKSFLHRIKANGELPKFGTTVGEKGKIQVVSAVKIEAGFEALVIGRPDMIAEDNNLQSLPLPPALQEDVARH